MSRSPASRKATMAPGASKWLYVLVLLGGLAQAGGTTEIFLMDTTQYTEPLGAFDYFEILFLGVTLFYADILSDVVSMVGFCRRGAYWFFGINLFGIFISSLGSAISGLLMDGILGGLAGFFQLHVAMHGAKVVWMKKKPKIDSQVTRLNVIFRAFELIEATMSLLPQGYSMIFDTNLKPEEELQLQVSVAISFASLAYGLVLLDRKESGASDYPAVQSLFSLDFVLIFAYRLCELVLGFGGLLLFHLATRPFGGFVVLAARVMFNVVQGVIASCGVDKEKAHYGHIMGCFLDKKQYYIFGCFSLIPSSFFFTGPVASNGLDLAIPGMWENRTATFVARTVGTVAMLSCLLFKAGGFQEMLGVWGEFNKSAISLACATLAAFVGYVALFPAFGVRYDSASGVERVRQAEKEAEDKREAATRATEISV